MRKEKSDFETLRRNVKLEAKIQKRKIDISVLGPECPMPPELEILEEKKPKAGKSISRLLRFSTVLLVPAVLLLILFFSFVSGISGFLTGLTFSIPFFVLAFLSFFCLKSTKYYCLPSAMQGISLFLFLSFGKESLKKIKTGTEFPVCKEK